MKKEYTINELSSILGCSRTAIVKKIKPDENNPVLKRYRGRYEVVSSNGSMAILLDDIELEHEKRMSKGVGNVSNNTVTTAQTDDIIDIEPEKQNVNSETLIEFTNRYIEQFTTLQKEMYNELKQRDNQILLLTTSEKTKESEYLQVKAENTTLKKRNMVLTVLTGIVLTVLICFITFAVTYINLSDSQSDQEIKKEPAPQEIPVKPVKR